MTKENCEKYLIFLKIYNFRVKKIITKFTKRDNVRTVKSRSGKVEAQLGEDRNYKEGRDTFLEQGLEALFSIRFGRKGKRGGGNIYEFPSVVVSFAFYRTREKKKKYEERKKKKKEEETEEETDSLEGS